MADHVHLLLGLKATGRLADVVRDIKAVSSRWICDQTGDRDFAWQEVHHRQRTFQKEYLERLHRFGVDFDERYLW